MAVEVVSGRGECNLRSIEREPGHRVVYVERADPQIRICADLLQEASVLTVRDEPRGASLVDDVFTIHGENRTVVYRVDFTDYDPADDSYAAEWPD